MALDQQEQALNQQYQSVDWATLAQEDPAQYSALHIQFQQAAQQIQAQKSQLNHTYQQTSQQLRESIKPKAMEAIRTQIPEMADPINYSNALNEGKSYLKAIGADEKNFDALEMDPVVFRVVRDAAKYHAMAAKQPEVSKKVRSAPKMQRPSPKEQLGASAKRIHNLKAQASQGNQDAMASLLESL